MKREDDFGREADGGKNELYCTHCYQNGAFTQPNLTKEQQIAQVADISAKKMGMPKEQASAMAEHMIPTLKRWQE